MAIRRGTPRRACAPRRGGGGVDGREEAASEVLGEAQSLMDRLPVDRPEALQLLQIDKLEQVIQAVIAPPRPIVDAKEVLVIVKTVITAGKPVQGPDILVPRGLTTVIRQRRHTGPTRTGYVGFERSDTGNSLNRMEFRDNDSISLRLEHLDSLWFDADNADTSFELIVEYGQRREVG